ncbi:MAG: Biphenyl 2,3-dioxygenase, ferredoxin component [Planctomycetes bacterium]|nr:Biphenyl 2,3-dioxygenase, ferredoxin component [Planctomycetota bacterium]
MTERRLCAAADLPPGAVRVFEVGPWSLAAARVANAVHVVENRCSHDDGPLGAGRLVEGASGSAEIECPRHGARFELATGRASRMPAVSPIERFPARVSGDDVLVDIPEDA